METRAAWPKSTGGRNVAVSLNLLSFLVASMLTGFGAFISVNLTAQGWETAQIGYVLSAGTIAAIVSQLPAGMLVDRRSARRAAGVAAILALIVALLLLALVRDFWLVLGAEVLAGIAAPMLGFTIASITLTLTEREALGERLGQNARYAGIGAAVGAGALGLVGTTISSGTVFVAAALFGVPAVLVLYQIRGGDRTISHPTVPPIVSRQPLHPSKRSLLGLLACCLGFHLANTALLPLAASEATRTAADLADAIIAVATVVPQALVAILSPWGGRLANRHGHRLVLLLGYAALPTRALLFAFDCSPHMIICGQMLDGVSASVFGVVLPLVVADITRDSGRFNATLGMVGIANAFGAASSNVAAGLIAEAIGLHATFVLLAALGIGATALVWLTTRDAAIRSPARKACYLVRADHTLTTSVSNNFEV